MHAPEADFEELMHEAESRPLIGWELSYGGRIRTRSPWDFGSIVEPYLRASPDLLDLGTGGGEWLSQLSFLPERTVATEGWEPNLTIARNRLSSRGVAVVGVESAPDNIDQASAGGELPFAAGAFQLIISRHESYLPGEVERVLRPGGSFLTQQVASGASDDIHRLLDLPVSRDLLRWDRDFAVRQLRGAGLSIEESADGYEIITFENVGAFAWYLKQVPFVYPDFSIPTHIRQLRRLHQDRRPIAIRQPLFWIRASKRPCRVMATH